MARVLKHNSHSECARMMCLSVYGGLLIADSSRGGGGGSDVHV